MQHDLQFDVFKNGIWLYIFVVFFYNKNIDKIKVLEHGKFTSMITESCCLINVILNSFCH